MPVEDEELKKEVIHILDIQLKDNTKARIMQPDGSYIIPEVEVGIEKLCAQDYFCKEAIAAVNASKKAPDVGTPCFEPMTSELEEL